MNLYKSYKNNPLKNIDLLGNIAWAIILPCLKGAAIGSVSDAVVQKCQCCYKQVGWRIWKCQTKDCPEINVCSVVVSAIIGCAAGYIPGNLIPTSLAALKQLALKTGGKAVAKWISTLPC